MQFPGTNILASQLNPQSLDGRKQALINHLVTGQDQRRSNPLIGAGGGLAVGQGLGAFNPHAVAALQQGNPDQASPFYGNPPQPSQAPPQPSQAPPPPSNPQVPPASPGSISTGTMGLSIPTGVGFPSPNSLPTNPFGTPGLQSLLAQAMYGNGFRAQ